MKDRLHSSATGVEGITVTTFDQFTSLRAINHVDLLKIDTEGYDINVLRGASEMLRKGAITFVYVEFHHYFLSTASQTRLGDLQSIVELLATHNYRLITTYTDSVHSDEDIGTHNALFVNCNDSRNWAP